MSSRDFEDFEDFIILNSWHVNEDARAVVVVDHFI